MVDQTEKATRARAGAEYFDDLRQNDPVVRQRARDQLAGLGATVVAPLVRLLTDPDRRVRWEAAKVLAAIRDPAATDGLIDALDDEDEDVRWVAAEALIATGRSVLHPLLRALIARSTSIQMCRSAHHVLARLTERQQVPELVRVLNALNHLEPSMSVPAAARAALERLALS